MNLRKSHDRSVWFDAVLWGLAVFGVVGVWIGLMLGGWFQVVAILGLIGEGLLGYAVLVEPSRLTVKRYRRALVAEPSGWMKVVFLSDLHAGGFHPTSWYERISREVQALKPELVIVGGDVVGDLSEPIAQLVSLKNVNARLGKYFVLGNHDLVDDPVAIRQTLMEYGYQDLTNTACELLFDGRSLELAGVDDHWYGNPQLPARRATILPRLLISHEPDVLMDLKEGDADLVLSGHTHGGQVRLPLIGPLWPIPSKLGRRVDRGEKILNGVALIISNGLGETDARLRLFSPPQIVVVELGI